MKLVDLSNKRFGMLIVKKYVGQSKWLCICDCGTETTVFASNLKTKHTVSCGCIKNVDLTDKTFGRLKVLKRAKSKMRGDTKRPMWICVCQCGNKITVYGDSLVGEATQSCGCIKKDLGMPDKIKKEFVEGTQISHLMSDPSIINKTGVVGVNWNKSKNNWQAGIRFKGIRYNLGGFDDFEEAVKIRKEAEEKIHGKFLEWYNSTKGADADETI